MRKYNKIKQTQKNGMSLKEIREECVCLFHNEDSEAFVDNYLNAMSKLELGLLNMQYEELMKKII